MSSQFLSKSSQIIMISIYNYNDIEYKLITAVDTYSKFVNYLNICLLFSFHIFKQ